MDHDNEEDIVIPDLNSGYDVRTASFSGGLDSPYESVITCSYVLPMLWVWTQWNSLSLPLQLFS
jgi:hypothetical protein